MSGRALFGLCLLIGLVVLGVLGFQAIPGGKTLVRRVADHAFGAPVPLVVTLPKTHGLSTGAAVYTVEGESFALVGRVTGVIEDGVEISVDPGCARRLDATTPAVAYTPAKNLAWIVRALVPPPMRDKVLLDMRAVWEKRQAATIATLKPKALALVSDITQILRDSLPAVLEQERPAIQRFVATVRDDLYPEMLRPALEQVLFPRLEQGMTDAASSIASDIAGKIELGDVLNVIWSVALDRVGLGEKADVEKKLRELFQRAALPVLKERGPELAKVAFSTLRESLRDPVLKQAIEKSTWELINHPSTQDVVDRIVDAWVLKNELLMIRLQEALKDEEIRAPFNELWVAAEPLLEGHLEEILSRDDGEGMDHRLVRVLRRVVLEKDAAYLLLEPEKEGRGLKSGDRLTGTLGVDP